MALNTCGREYFDLAEPLIHGGYYACERVYTMVEKRLTHRINYYSAMSLDSKLSRIHEVLTATVLITQCNL